MNKCILWVGIILMLFSFAKGHADTFNDSDDNTNQNTDTTNTQNPATTGGTDGLLGEMQKKTEKALKTFKNLTDKGQSKKSFFADEGSTPTSSELEGASFGDSDTPDEKEFKIPGSNTGGPFSSGSGGSN